MVTGNVDNSEDNTRNLSLTLMDITLVNLTWMAVGIQAPSQKYIA